ncbi:MAG: AAA family ATPase [Armatimonadaceae bacterium]
MAILILICGLPGAGKTTLARQLEQSRQAVRLCPDAWIKAVIADESDRAELDRLRDPVEKLQWEMAQRLLTLGVTVILENGFWSREERTAFRTQAQALGAAVELHYLQVPKDELWRRIEQRNRDLDNESFYNSRDEVEEWWRVFEPPDPEELAAFDLSIIYPPTANSS